MIDGFRKSRYYHIPGYKMRKMVRFKGYLVLQTIKNCCHFHKYTTDKFMDDDKREEKKDFDGVNMTCNEGNSL